MESGKPLSRKALDGIDPEKLYDVCVVGGGPAGLTAGLYLARGGCRVLVVEKESFGGQIAITDEVVNYPGVGKTDGKTLTETMKRQAESFGADFLTAEVTGVYFSEDVKTLRTTSSEINCLGAILATGAHPKTVGFVGEEEHRGRGVAYCATCDGQFFTGREIFVVGGGYAAAEEAVFLTKYGRNVTILIRGEDFSCAKEVADKARNHPGITVLTHTVLEEVKGEQKVNFIRLKNTVSGEIREISAPEGDFFGVFVFAGYAPNTALVDGVVELDEKGYILTDSGKKTNLSGVYAAGDVCVKPLRQVVTAVGDGATAATELEKYVTDLRQRLGLPPHTNRTFPHTQQHPTEGLSTPSTTFVRDNAGFDPNLPPKSPLEPGLAGQMKELLGKMDGTLRLKLYLDDRAVSRELEALMEALATLSEKVTVERAAEGGEERRPCVEICDGSGKGLGLWFHGVPGGHEFTSFALALYNAAGPGQPLEEDLLRRARALKPGEVDLFVTLSCTLCPDVVTAAQRLTLEAEGLEAHVFDIKHFPALAQRHGILSVPCMVYKDKTTFGRKSAREILAWLEE